MADGGAMTAPIAGQRAMSPAIRYHGAKFRLAGWVMQHFPPHRCYVEPFGGAAGVLIQKPRSFAEVYNDLDGDVVNFFRVLRDPEQRAQLVQLCTLTPYARAEFELAWEPATEPIERARRLAVRAQMGFGSAGATKGNTGFRSDTKRRYGTAQSEWLRFPANLALVGERLSGVVIENRNGADVMRLHDTPDTLHFVDPPYLPETRVLGHRGNYYQHEMCSAQHAELLAQLLELKGMVVLAGYDSALYRDTLCGWEVRTRSVAISGFRGSATRTEMLWISPNARNALGAGLFSHQEANYG